MQYEVLRSHHVALHTCIAQTRLQGRGRGPMSWNSLPGSWGLMGQRNCIEYLSWIMIMGVFKLMKQCSGLLRCSILLSTLLPIYFCQWNTNPSAPSTITARVEPPLCQTHLSCRVRVWRRSMLLHCPAVSWPIRNHNRHINLHSVTFYSFKMCKLFAEFESQRQSIAMQNAKCNSLRSTFSSDKWSEERS